MTVRHHKIRLTLLLTCSAMFVGALAVSATLERSAGATATTDATSSLFAPPSPDATSAATGPLSPDASADLSALKLSEATTDLFAPASPDATSAPAPIATTESLPTSTPPTADVITVTVADLIAAGFKDVKAQEVSGTDQRFYVHDTKYFRVNQTNLDAKSRWTAEGAADIVSVFVSPKRGCPSGIAGDPKLITYEGRIQVRFCHSETSPIYIVVTGPDQTKAIELADIIDRK